MRNRRFQNIARHFKSNAFYEGKTASLEKIVQFANGEQKAVRSSTNSSTQTRQTSPLEPRIFRHHTSFAG
ncbi:MAG: hypothetical protein DME54_00760 [Verrucomicrobia bacterium]|nr:MAG: hypothetical protein DMF09_12010 [Verrucomicrobiota bacterium]PYK36494.1 MAG: hypothetical protein DME54_00760 [Verrucomicrobiota bacterium]PYL21610.1 MAG: hypothetical protein DMF41_01840 [Verrucomicrobiota bacterium]